MFNLLPKAAKDTIRREYRVRLAAVALFFLSAALVIAALMLLPSWFLSAQKEAAARARADALVRSLSQRSAAGLEQELRTAQQRLNLLSREAPVVSLYELTERIAAGRPPGVSLESITFSRTPEGRRAAFVSGTARDRAALVSFSRSLERARAFEKVDLPLSALAKEKDLIFSLTAVLPP